MKQVSLRLPDDLVEELDALAGLVPRERYIRDLLTQHVAATKSRDKVLSGRSAPISFVDDS